jgi:2-polyprenyl-3-methyl-5-hydroxy-6-metoxy-1,4-benzoquinol methylase
MTFELDKLVDRGIIFSDELKIISPDHQQWLSDVLRSFNGLPNLNELWELMDKQWQNFDCDPKIIDSRIGAYYAHPVWLLNGLFIEQHAESLNHRVQFKNWVVCQAPHKVAELGGGFGGLARMIGAEAPSTAIEIIEPYPTAIGVSRAEKTANVCYRPEMFGEYDVLLATDVFEHVSDPLQLLYETAQHLRIGGRYLIANCFYPVIRCHLPQTFHFRHSWGMVLQAMGLEPAEKVAYGRAFVRRGALNFVAARQVEQQSLKLWRVTQYLPGRLARPLTEIITLV